MLFNQRTSRIITCVLATAIVMPSVSIAQNRGTTIVPGVIQQTPGTYQLEDTAAIAREYISFSKQLQQQDQEQYQKITEAAKTGYLELYNMLQALRDLSVQSTSTQLNAITAEQHLVAINNFKRSKDQLTTETAALAVLKDVWAGISGVDAEGKTSNKLQTVGVYQKGQLNLEKLLVVYERAINNMTAEAANLPLRVRNNMTVVTVPKGMSLEPVQVQMTPAALQQQYADIRLMSKITEDEKETKLKPISVEIATHMDKFLGENGLKLYWQNDKQKGDREEWIESLLNKAKIIKYVRAVYCAPTGVPAIDIPKPTMLNLDYLKRGGSSVRLVQTATFEEDEIRATLTRFDQYFVSVESQSGAYNDIGGIGGMIHRVNSTFTWHNEVYAYLSMMKILRDMYVDELDLQTNSVMGCEKVRERYYSMYGSIRNDAKTKAQVDELILGANSGMTNMQVAFSSLGELLIGKIAYAKKAREFLKSHPAASAIGQAIEEDPDLK